MLLLVELLDTVLVVLTMGVVATLDCEVAAVVLFRLLAIFCRVTKHNSNCSRMILGSSISPVSLSFAHACALCPAGASLRLRVHYYKLS